MIFFYIAVAALFATIIWLLDKDSYGKEKTMLNKIKCEKCKFEFTLTNNNVFMIEEGEYQVTFFACPKCNAKYHVLTTDEDLRGLIEKRKKQENLVRMARTRQFTKKTTQKYLNELGEVKKKITKRAEDLKPKGDEILAKCFPDNDEEHPTEQS